MAEESAVKVCVRVRPLIEREQTAATEAAKPVQLYWRAEEKSIHQIDDGNTTKSFSFDRVFSAEETTNQLYQDIAKPLVVSTVEGYNGTIFAYGQTSSGKTHTMMGSDPIPGVIPLAMAEVFETIKSNPKKEFLLRVSYMEIYNETVTDLLVDSWKRKPLEVRETINKNVYVADLTEELVTSPAQALAWIRKGEKNRHYGKTKMNQRSSRSHTIFRMILESRERSDPLSGENADGAIIVSHLNLVDLAGSERASQTGAEGARFKEGCNINKSLFTLGQVIKKLSDESQRGFTNYRDSKLTRILQNSLGGNAKTVIICTITPVAVEETLSTLQFASTAKNMKNDPHVTEVSDDGALLKRYRNEIVDLKRRLQEVSAVTHNTVTEKETLSQILQEKDQLQREQEDRIKNLTKLLVTSANFVPMKKDPKRRVTWGGKLASFAQVTSCGARQSDLSFVEPFHKRRKANLSTLTDLGEDDEDFDSNWDLPDMEVNRTSGTVQSFEDSSVVFVSPNRDLSDKVSQLEQQLEMEVRQKDEATTKLETLDRRLGELTLQLETETQQKQEAVEKVEMLENKLAEVDGRLSEEAEAPNEVNDQLRKEYAEAIQLCEVISSEKETLVSELEYLKQELGMFIEHTETLEKEKTSLSEKLEEKMEYVAQLERDKTALSQELEERKEIDEFKSLEDACEKDSEKELQNEISRLKECLESTELRCQELEANLESMSEELKKKSDWVEELETLSDKDLAQQVKQLRRSLDDAEGLSRDTKKEWAFLRSENIALKERDVTLTATYEKMEADVGSLRVQLDSEKNRFKKMQTDLQKELQGAFHENTKLTTLLDGKVPKDLIDSVVLERTVADLKKELTTSQVEEEALRNQLDELKPLQNLPDKVNDLMKQVCELTETMCGVEAQRDSLLSAQTHSQEQAQHLEEALQISQDEVARIQDNLKTAELREQDLTQKCADTTELLETLRLDLELATSEKSQLLESVKESSLKLNETDLQRASLEEKLNELQQLVKDLEEQLADSELLRCKEEEIGKELQEQLDQLTEGLHRVESERDCLLSEKMSNTQDSSDKMEKLLSTVTSLTEERDQLQQIVEGLRQEKNQLKDQLEENMEMLVQTQMEQNQQQPLNSELQAQDEQLSLLKHQLSQLTQDLESVRAERDGLHSEKTANIQKSAEELELLQSQVTCLTEERDQLKMDLQENVEIMIETQEELRSALEKTRKQKEQIRHLTDAQASRQDSLTNEPNGVQLEELQNNIKQITEDLHVVRAERDGLLSRMENTQASSEEMEKLLSTVTCLTEERDQLQQIVEGLRQEKNQLKEHLEENMEMAQTKLNQQQPLNSELQENDEKVSLLQEQLNETEQQGASVEHKLNEMQQQVKDLEDKLAHSELSRRTEEDIGKELQEQLTADLESLRAERDSLLSEKTRNAHNSSEEMEKLLSTVTCLTEERDQLQQIVEGLRQEKNQLKEQLEENIEMVQSEQNRYQPLNSELQVQDETVSLLQQQMEELSATLHNVTEQKQQLESDLQRNMEMASESGGLLRSVQEELKEQKQINSDIERQSQDKETHLQQQINTLTEDLQCVRAEKDSLLLETKASVQNSSEEMEKLLSTVTCLTEERDQLQQIVEGLRQEKNQLKEQLEENMEMILQMRKELSDIREERNQLQRDLQDSLEKVSQIQELLKQLQVEREQQEAELKKQVQQLEEELLQLKETQLYSTSSEKPSEEVLDEANTTPTVPKEQLGDFEDQNREVAERGLSLRLQDSTQQLQESFKKFQHFVDICSNYSLMPMDNVLKVQRDLMYKHLTTLPISTATACNKVDNQTEQIITTLGDTKHLLKCYALDYKLQYEQLVQSDLAVFEERRMQDVLLCRAQAPSYSVKEEDFKEVWDNRLSEMLGKRETYLQKMDNLLERLWASMATYPSSLSEELRDRKMFNEELRLVFTNQELDLASLDNILSSELDRCTAVVQNKEMALEGLCEEHRGLTRELEQLNEQGVAQLTDQRSRTATLLQMLDGVSVKTEVDLLNDNQQLSLQLEQSEKEVEALNIQIEQLAEEQKKAKDRISNHKQATQLLQTELQDACAQVQEKEGTIQVLQGKLQETEANAKRNTSPSAIELEELRAKVVKMELKLTTASSKYEEEIQRMTTVLKHKEESLRKLKETLRESQSQEEESFLQGKNLYTRLTQPKGHTVQSSIHTEKTKLEEEVKQLKLKIEELESLVSSQQAEIAKWKSRATKLKEKGKVVLDKPPSPCTPTKKRLPMSSESSLFLNSPKKLLDSSKMTSLLNSPKSKFFDVQPDSESLSKRPKQFFDNTSLGTGSEVWCIPTITDEASVETLEKDKAAGVENNEWWPLSPKQADVCKTQ